MSYEIEGLSEEGLKEILKCLPEESLSHAALYLALRDGPEPIGRVFDSVTNNFLMELPKEARSPGYGFYCFWCNGKHYEFLRLESFLPDIVMRSTLPADFSLDEFLHELMTCPQNPYQSI